MKRSQKRDAVLNEKFFFRTNISSPLAANEEDKKPVIKELTINEIINGTEDGCYPGLLTIVQDYLKVLSRHNYVETMNTYSNKFSLPIY